MAQEDQLSVFHELDASGQYRLTFIEPSGKAQTIAMSASSARDLAKAMYETASANEANPNQLEIG